MGSAILPRSYIATQDESERKRTISVRFCLRHAEPVAQSVAHDRLGSVEPFLRRACELHAAALQLFVGLAAIVDFERARTEHPLRSSSRTACADSSSSIGPGFGSIRTISRSCCVFGPHGQPTESVVHRVVGAHLEPELVDVEVFPTASQISVTGIGVVTSSSRARSRRRSRRYWCGVRPVAARNARMKWKRESPASFARRSTVSGCV
jgi:hypothetical protein